MPKALVTWDPLNRMTDTYENITFLSLVGGNKHTSNYEKKITVMFVTTCHSDSYMGVMNGMKFFVVYVIKFENKICICGLKLKKRMILVSNVERTTILFGEQTIVKFCVGCGNCFCSA